MRGRKPKPTGLRVIEGNPGKRSPSQDSPSPTCPSHLNPSAKAEWKRLAHEMHALGIISNLDRGALAAYCQAYGRWVEAERKLKETPALLKLANGTVQANPWLAIATKQLELMQRSMSELGLSPVSRTRVQVKPIGPKPWEYPSMYSGLLGGGPPNADDHLSGRYKP